MRKSIVIFIMAFVVFALPTTGRAASDSSDSAFESQIRRSATVRRQRPGVVRRSYRSGKRTGRKVGRKTVRGTRRGVRATRKGTVRTYRRTKRVVY